MKRSCLLFAQLFCVLMISSAQNSEKEISLKAVISQMTASDCIKKLDPTDFGYPHYMVAASEMMGELYPSGGGLAMTGFLHIIVESRKITEQPYFPGTLPIILLINAMLISENTV